MDELIVRKMNLIDLCLEDHEDVPEPPEHAAALWSEDQIKAYFESGGDMDGYPSAENAAAVAPAAPTPLSVDELRAKYPAVAEAEFASWFPGLTRSKTQLEKPKMRLVCFTNAGNEENVFTMEGVGARKVAVLLEWCRAKQVEVLAVQLPGRGKRVSESFITTTPEVAKATLRVLGSKLIDVPYCVIGHSVGTWNSFELLGLLREEGFPMPLKTFFSAFPSPDIPTSQRPWKANRSMPDAAFMDEAREWDVNEVVFREDMWKQYSPLMRADFLLFDEYDFKRGEDKPFDFPITTFYAVNDRKVKKPMVEGWRKFTSKDFACHEIAGHHLYVMGLNEQKPAKEAWFSTITSELEPIVIGL